MKLLLSCLIIVSLNACRDNPKDRPAGMLYHLDAESRLLVGRSIRYPDKGDPEIFHVDEADGFKCVSPETYDNIMDWQEDRCNQRPSFNDFR